MTTLMFYKGNRTIIVRTKRTSEANDGHAEHDWLCPNQRPMQHHGNPVQRLLPVAHILLLAPEHGGGVKNVHVRCCRPPRALLPDVTCTTWHLSLCEHFCQEHGPTKSRTLLFESVVKTDWWRYSQHTSQYNDMLWLAKSERAWRGGKWLGVRT